ncbi:hypothetical protein [Chitinimonas sp.]|uniref:hypothetical protein n=1 Tax=Chitinimonas sp. TaxID=1934313 RepID=UPI0035B1FE20
MPYRYLLLICLAAGQAHAFTNIELSGKPKEFITAESTSKPLLPTLQENIPEGWSVVLRGEPVAPPAVQVQGGATWLENLDKVGRDANLHFRIDAREMRVVVEQANGG